MRFILVGLLALIPFLISAQGIVNPRDSTGYHCPAIVVDGDTIAVMTLDEVYIWGNKLFRNSAEMRQWERLVRNVKKAYPYAKLAGIKFNEYNQKISNVKSEKVQKAMMKQAEDELEAQFGKELRDLTISQGKISNVKSEKVQKAMMKQAEDELEAQFGKELRDLTISQGKILLKLIDRQTNNSSYDIVKDFRGKFRAFFYQSFARLFSYNLKVKYDPLGEDADIERIVLMIESGSI